MEERATHTPKEPVVSSTVRKKGIIRTLLDEIILANMDDIKEHFIDEVVVPATLDWLYDLTSSFINNIFKTGNNGRSSGSTLPMMYRGGNTSYSNYYHSAKNRQETKLGSKTRSSYRDIGYKTRADAEKVLFALRETAEHYQFAMVSDFLEFSNAPADMRSLWTLTAFGWTLPMLEHIRISLCRDGMFYMDLPNPVPIDYD